MNKPDRLLASEILRCRERNGRMMKRVWNYLKNHNYHGTVDEIVEAATLTTLRPCISVLGFILVVYSVVRIKGGYLFYAWILFEGNPWLLDIARANLEVNFPPRSINI